MNLDHDIKESEPPDFLKRTVVLIPALNEEASLSFTIDQWRRLGVGRIRVVDNGSTDGTVAVAKGAGVEVVIEPRAGYGAAAWLGLQNWPGDFEWVLFSSADGSDLLRPSEAGLWQQAVTSGADLILGDRTASQSEPSDLNAVQRLGNWFICRALHVGWGARFRDMGSMRLIRHSTLMSLGLRDRGFGWNVEMQIRALQRGLKIVELPVSYPPRRAGHSKISGSWRGTLRAGWGIVRMLGKMWRWRRQGGRDFASTLPAAKSRRLV